VSAFYKFLRVFTATVISLISGILTLFLFGMMLPIWTMIFIYGRQEVEDAPAHGGIILFMTVPIVGILVLLGIVPFGTFIHRKISN
jgi:hypothetical protein